jgi:hypothetical protein
MVFVAEHSTLISKARSGCAAQFLDSNCDVWLSLDDDAETGPKELALLFAATMVHHLVVLPQLRRDQSGTINVMFPTEPRRGDDHLEHLVIGARSPQFSDASSRILPIASAGCSIMAADRHALQTMRDAFPELDCHRQPERRLLALFLEEVRHAQWIGEDASFFRRAHAAGLVPKVLVDVETAHAGRHLPSNWLDTLSTP